MYDWLKRGKSLKPEKPGPKQPRKLDLLALKALIEQKPDAYLDELAKELNIGKPLAPFYFKGYCNTEVV